MKTVTQYLASLDAKTLHSVVKIMAAKEAGTFKAAADPQCNSTNCTGRTGCTPTTVNGDCECVNGVCTWIPLL